MPPRPRYLSSSVAALVLGLSAFPLAAQPCQATLKPAAQEALAALLPRISAYGASVSLTVEGHTWRVACVWTQRA